MSPGKKNVLSGANVHGAERKKMKIDTKAIRFKLMSERAKEYPKDHNGEYYNGCMDALTEVEKAILADSKRELNAKAG